MKNNPFKYFVFLMLSLLMVATTGCTEDDISMPAGQLPDETPMNSVGGQLCSGKTFSNKITVSMYEGDGAVTEEICYALTKPAITAVTVKAIPSPELVAQYNSDNETDMKEFPVANVTLGNGGSLTVAAGKKESGKSPRTVQQCRSSCKGKICSSAEVDRPVQRRREIIYAVVRN